MLLHFRSTGGSNSQNPIITAFHIGTLLNFSPEATTGEGSDQDGI